MLAEPETRSKGLWQSLGLNIRTEGPKFEFYGILYSLRVWGPFLESPVNFTGPKSNIQIEI